MQSTLKWDCLLFSTTGIVYMVEIGPLDVFQSTHTCIHMHAWSASMTELLITQIWFVLPLACPVQVEEHLRASLPLCLYSSFTLTWINCRHNWNDRKECPLSQQRFLDGKLIDRCVGTCSRVHLPPLTEAVYQRTKDIPVSALVHWEIVAHKHVFMNEDHFGDLSDHSCASAFQGMLVEGPPGPEGPTVSQSVSDSVTLSLSLLISSVFFHVLFYPQCLFNTGHFSL